MKLHVRTLLLSLCIAAPLAHAHDMGSGYNGGPGACPGMMGGGGMAPGMMGTLGEGSGPYSTLNLSEEQKSQVAQIQKQFRKQHWQLMGMMREESIKLRNMMAQENPDPQAVGKQQMRVADIHRQMLESRIDAQNRINALLTPEQRAQIKNYGPGWMMVDQ